LSAFFLFVLLNLRGMMKPEELDAGDKRKIDKAG
jgi:hypothetical protein